MKTSSEDKVANRIRWGYLTAFLLLLASYILSFYTTKQLVQQTQLVTRTNNIINNLDRVLSDIKDAEAGLRGFYLTDNEEYLVPFRESRADAEVRINTLVEDTRHEPQIDSLRTLINLKYQVMDMGLAAHVEGVKMLNEQQSTYLQLGKSYMDRIRVAARVIQDSESRKMTMEQKQMGEFSNSISAINIASLLVAILLGVYSIVMFNKENKARKESDAAAMSFRSELEEKVKQSDKVNQELIELRSLEKFAATGRISRTIAHEVRNPLTNINLATEHLRSELPQNDEIDVLLEMITRNANRINVLISDLLNSTRAAHLNFEKSSLNQLMDESLALAQDRIKLNNIQVLKSYDKNVCEIMVDPEKIKIAFLNIMVNAIEAMDPEHGVLKLSSKVSDDKCVINISDNGKGMDKESVSRLFEPYFTTKETGTGLGLTNTHNIILNHKASIKANSEIGKGTSFTIIFGLT